MTQFASPVSRRVNVAFTPGQTTSIILVVKGYPTAVSFFDKTGAPWPIEWDTNFQSGRRGGRHQLQRQLRRRAGCRRSWVLRLHPCRREQCSRDIAELAEAAWRPAGYAKGRTEANLVSADRRAGDL